MKILVMKLGGNLNRKGNGIGVAEALFFADELAKKHEVTLVSKEYRTKTDEGTVYVQEEGTINADAAYKKLNEYDKLIVWSGNLNFFGGAENEYFVWQLAVLSNFKGEIKLVLNDYLAKLAQFEKAIRSKPWGEKYKDLDLHIKTENIDIISNYIDNEFQTKSMKFKSVNYYPTCIFTLYQYSIDQFINVPLEYHLVYGGTMRGKRRNEQFKKYIFSEKAKNMEAKIHLFHNIDLKKMVDPKTGEQIIDFDKFNLTVTKKKLSYEDFLMETAKGQATVLLTDKNIVKYQKIQGRFWEALVTNTKILLPDFNEGLFKFPELKTLKYDNRVMIEKYKELFPLENFNKLVEGKEINE